VRKLGNEIKYGSGDNTRRTLSSVEYRTGSGYRGGACDVCWISLSGRTFGVIPCFPMLTLVALPAFPSPMLSPPFSSPPTGAASIKRTGSIMQWCAWNLYEWGELEDLH